MFNCSKFLTQEYLCAIHDKQATIFRSYDVIYRKNIVLCYPLYFFDVVPQNAESKVVPEYEVGHGGFLQMFKGRRLNIYHCAYFRNTRHAVSFLE